MRMTDWLSEQEQEIVISGDESTFQQYYSIARQRMSDREMFRQLAMILGTLFSIVVIASILSYFGLL